jgi:hypothetical protein
MSVIEAATSTAILVLMVTGLLGLLRMGGVEFGQNLAKMTTDDSASLGMQRLCADIRDGLTASTANNGADLYVTVPVVNTEGDYDRFAAGGTNHYYLAGGKLCRQQGASAPVAVGRNISSVSFSVAGSQVTAQLTTSKRGGLTGLTTTLSGQVSLRNQALDHN